MTTSSRSGPFSWARCLLWSWLLLTVLALVSCRGKVERALDSKEQAEIARVLATPEVQAQLPTQGHSWLLKAIESRNEAGLQSLLEAGVDPTVADPDGRTPLHHAVDADESRLVKVLVAHGADPTRPDTRGRTPLHDAVTQHHYLVLSALLEHVKDIQPLARGPQGLLALSVTSGESHIVELLIQAGARIEDVSVLPPTSDPSIRHQLELGHLAWLVSAAIEKEDVQTLKTLLADADESTMKVLGLTAAHLTLLQNDRQGLTQVLADEPEMGLAEDARGLGLLHYAAVAAEPRMVEVLTSARVDIDARTKEGRTPLMLAAEKGRALMVSALLKQGASVNAEDSQGQSALTLALQGDNPKTVSRLVEAGAVKVQREAPSPPAPEAARAEIIRAHQRFQLLWAADAGDFVSIAEVLREGASPDAALLNQVPLTPLHLAVLQNDPARLEAAALQYSTPLAEPPLVGGWTLAHWAAASNADKSVDWLASRGLGVDPRGGPGRESSTPLQLAIRARHLAAASRLVAQGACLEEEMEEVPDKPMREFMARALSNGQLRQAWARGDLSEVRELLKKGAVLEAFRGSSSLAPPTALQQRLLRDETLTPEQEAELAGAPPDPSGNLPLHYAVLSSLPATLEAVLRNRPEINRGNHRGLTALHLAATRGDEAVLRRLLQAGTDVNALARRPDPEGEDEGYTPLMAAVASGHVPAVNALLDAGARIDLKTRKHLDPLEIAACAHPSPLVQLLLSRGARPEANSSCWKQALSSAIETGSEDEALKRLAISRPTERRGLMLQSIQANQLHLLRALLVGPQGFDASEREAALATCASLDKLSCVDMLFSLEPVDPRVLDGSLAYSFDKPELAEWLLAHGADPFRTRSARDDLATNSPVGMALEEGAQSFVALLAKRPELWARVRSEPSLLRAAVHGGFVDLVRGYVEAGADPKHITLSEVGSAEVLDYLRGRGVPFPSSAAAPRPSAQDAGEAPREPSEDVLGEPIGSGRLGAVRLMLSKGFRPQVRSVVELIQDRFLGQHDGRPPSTRDIEMLRTLLAWDSWTPAQRLEFLAAAMARPGGCTAPILDSMLLERLTPAELRAGARPLLEQLVLQCRDTQTLELLVSKGADLNAVDDSGRNVLAAALESRDASRAWRLLELGIQTRPRGKNPLAYVNIALEHGHDVLAQELLEHGVAEDAWKDREALGTAFARAMRRNNAHLAALLLARGADPRGRDEEGKTGLVHALDRGQEWIARLLIELGATDTEGVAFQRLTEKSSPLVNKLVLQGEVPLDTLISDTRLPAVHDELWRRLLSHPERFTPEQGLHLVERATGENQLELLRVVIDRLHPDVNRVGGGEYGSLLGYAAISSNLATVEFVLEHSGGLNEEGMECQTPLDHARYRKDDEGRRIVRFLKSKGARPGPSCNPGPQ